MKILIAGGGGEVGKHLTKEFIGQGHEVAVLDRAGKEKEIERREGVTFFPGSLSDHDLIHEALRGADMVINLAWSFADDPPVVFAEDIEGHINLLEAVASSKIRSFIYTSTAAVYGRAVTHPVTENHPCLIAEARKPLYALGKYTAEELCRYYYKERGVPAVIFRFWWAFGDTIGGSNLRNLIRTALKHHPLEMVQGAGGLFATMADLAGAVISGAMNPAAAGETYNIGSFFLTWQEIGEIIIRLTHSRSAIDLRAPADWQGPAFLNEIWDLDLRKAKAELGFEPRLSPEAMKSLFTAALESCILQVQKETSTA